MGETLSITQLEYEAAVKQGTDVLPFILDPKSAWWAEFDERKEDPEINTWRELLQKRHGAEFFTLEPRSIDMTGALGRWLARRNEGQPDDTELHRIEWPDGKSPYPGLLSFDQEYADLFLFFGRKREVDAIIAKMSEPQGRFVIISGASGSGKSSVVGAGVWRALIREGRVSGSKAWEWLRIHHGEGERSPFEALAWGLKQTSVRIDQPGKLAAASGRSHRRCSSSATTRCGSGLQPRRSGAAASVGTLSSWPSPNTRRSTKYVS
jgi:hypothetical protein